MDEIKPLETSSSKGIINPSSVRMKSYTNLIISIAIVVVTLAVGAILVASRVGLLPVGTNVLTPVELRFSDKNFKLSYSDLPPDYVYLISSFEEGDGWQGDMRLDSALVWDGVSTLVLESQNNNLKEAHLVKKINLTPYQKIKITIYLQTDPGDLESVKLYFGNKDKSSYYYYLITNLVKGWNFVQIEKAKFSSFGALGSSLSSPSAARKESNSADWGNIDRVGLELVSRVNSTATAYFDNLKAIQAENYLDDWLATNTTFLDLAKNDKGIITVQAKNHGESVALIRAISGVSDLTLKAKVQPMSAVTRSGLVVRGDYKTEYGYYFLIDGIDGSRWQIAKKTLASGRPTLEILKNGIINNFTVENNKPIWLKAEIKGQELKFSLSTNGSSYTLLGQVRDGDIKQGGVGIVVLDAGVAEFDNFEFNQ